MSAGLIPSDDRIAVSGLQSMPSMPLVVDLDGTLILTDLLFECAAASVFTQIRRPRALLSALMKGRAAFKRHLSADSPVKVDLLPYNEALLAYLRTEHARGRILVLATAADMRLARQVADHVGLFHTIIASDGETNVKGANKLALIRERLGDQPFEYIGNDHVDLEVWAGSSGASHVNLPGDALKRLRRLHDTSRAFDVPQNRIRDLLRGMRLHQWLKNLLVLVPLAAAHKVSDPATVGMAVLGFLAFSLCASSVYLVNDVLDAGSDRQHIRKRFRPVASGKLTIKYAAGCAALLLAASLAVAALLPSAFIAVLAGYYALTSAYSMWLKRISTLDVFVLAGLYTVRMIGGAVAVGIPLSFWLLAFSMFLFLSLAMVKRVSEIVATKHDGREKLVGRGYAHADEGTLVSLGTASGYTAVLVLALYINSEEVQALYEQPEILWLICPLLLYWLSRTWVGSLRGKITDDPIVFALRDRVSRTILLAAGLTALTATIGIGI